jgi:hypothetical protein
MKTRIGRPSPALIIAVIALVFALVGTGYAAFKVPKKSIGTAQLKGNAVTNAKVKDNTLTGKKLKLSTLGTVPTATNATNATNATHANVADLANSLPLPALHVIGAPGEPGFLEGSSGIPGTGPLAFPPVSFFKDASGVVHLEGIVKPGTGPRSFILPPGFRPAPGKVIYLPQLESGIVLIFGSNVFLEGQDFSGVVLVAAPNGFLTGESFRAES